ncbi:MAG: 16S rRNA (guanine(527)-N(7))-methyltransferase RsmG [Phycisphaerales bacterium]|nr:16S rRNA (guanine(527)-N(7))-methyltransferase RsmG [Phycisphaerales bacterium]
MGPHRKPEPRASARGRKRGAPTPPNPPTPPNLQERQTAAAPSPPPRCAPTPEFLGAASTLGIEFEPGDVDRLGVFLALLLEANTRFNLTAIADPGEAWIRHILDALTLLPMLTELPEGSRVLDVGSGGGVPAIPLAIVCPGLRFTLLEATGKKADFLREVAAALGLANVEIVQGRAEREGQNRGDRGPDGSRAGGFREAFDAVTARAVGRLAVVAELTVPFARVGGLVLLIKGQKADEELAEAGGAPGTLGAVLAGRVDTPTGRVLVFEKVGPTPRTYPRRDGEPKRSPLGASRRAKGSGAGGLASGGGESQEGA